MNGINVYNMKTVIEDLPQDETELEDGSWTIARPIGRKGLFWRLKCAWKGKADVLTFVGQ